MIAAHASMNRRQRLTTVSNRVHFLTTEAAEVTRAYLELDGCYGETAQEGAKEQLDKELCDVLWNVLVLAQVLDVDLDGGLEQLLEKNRNRVWPNDELGRPEEP